MTFSAFFNSIATHALKDIARHWYEVRRGKLMPSWEDIQPRAIAAHLPIVWSFKYDPTSGGFTGRLAGDRITQLFGRNFRSLALADAQPSESFPSVQAMLTRVVTEPALYRGGGRVLKQLDRFGEGERIILPLASDGINADCVFGATEYNLPQIVSDIRVQTVTEMEEWFSLKAVE